MVSASACQAEDVSSILITCSKSNLVIPFHKVIVFIIKFIMKNTNRKGDIAELAVAKKFLELGYWVSYPFGDDAPYDLIVDMNGSLKRIQVKHLKPRNNALHFRLYSDSDKPYKETTDLMVGYNPENMEVYVINPNNFNAEKIISLKLSKPKNNQVKGVNLAENYLLK